MLDQNCLRHNPHIVIGNNRISTGEAITERRDPCGKFPLRTCYFKQLYFLPLIVHKYFDLRDRFLINLFAHDCEAKERVQRLLLASLGVHYPHAMGVERAVVCVRYQGVLKWESGGEVRTMDSFFETRRADKKRGIFVAIPPGVLEAANGLAYRRRCKTSDVIYEWCRIAGEVQLIPILVPVEVSRGRWIEVA